MYKFISMRNIAMIRWENPDVITREEYLEKILPIQNEGLIRIEDLISTFQERSEKIFEIIRSSVYHQIILDVDTFKDGKDETIIVFHNEKERKGFFITVKIDY